MAEWGRTGADSSHAMRRQRLDAGVGLGGSFRLRFDETVFDDDAADTLTGGTGGSANELDWFFDLLGQDADDLNVGAGEKRNNSP